ANVPGERSPVPTERRADATDATTKAQNAAYGAVTQAKAPAPIAPRQLAQAYASAQGGNVQLPKSATDAELRMIFGALLCFLSLLLFAFNRWRRAQVRFFTM